MKRKKSGGGGANWMDTYGDMVTLLLCFFVLLYSMASVDENKWMALVKSFNPNAVLDAEEDSGNPGPLDDPEDGTSQEEVDDAMEELYQALLQYAKENGAEQSIETTKGDGYVFVSFDNAVFFEGDSYVLLPEGEKVLTDLSDILSKAAPYIDEVRVMGHTAQASTDQPNNPTVDRFLSSNRATIATVYIQDHSTLDPARILSEGYGQHRPVDTNDSEENRSHNRRVEIVITGLNLMDDVGDSVKQYYSLREGEETANSSAPTTVPVEQAGRETE